MGRGSLIMLSSGIFLRKKEVASSPGLLSYIDEILD